MSFEDRFFFSRKSGIGGGGWVHPKVVFYRYEFSLIKPIQISWNI